ncbi:colanic acid biosynthesis glycosyl transferase WcaI [Pseudacidovorax sp. 1753]|uniref:glycosyltransferase WbuB n=1 Tax=Pseudacidovorax sp. 1753 TaxID=3156419 RepID=UPI00339869B9
MNLLFCSINYAPELTGVGKYTAEMAEELAAKGHAVTVITAPPYYPEWKIGAGYSSYLYRVEESRGVRIIRCPIWIPVRPKGVSRLIYLASFALSVIPAFLYCLKFRANIIFVTEPPLICAPWVLLWAKITRARSWLHIQDYEVDAAFDLGIIKGARLKNLILKGERFILGRFDRISTISFKMIELAENKGVRREVVYFPNWVDLSAITPLRRPSVFREKLGIDPEAIVALYSGNMGAKQGLEILAEVARQVGSAIGVPKIFFVFCGNGAGRPSLEQNCQSLGNVRFLDLQPVEQLGSLLGLADIHLLPQRADAADLVMPSKLTGMLASGRPVIATAHAETELGGTILRAQCGLVVEPGNATAFSDAIVAMARDKELRENFGRRAREYAERNLGKDAVLRSLESSLARCCES